MKSPAARISPISETINKNGKLVRKHLGPVIFLYLLPAFIITLGQILFFAHGAEEFRDYVSQLAETKSGGALLSEIVHHLTSMQKTGLLIGLLGGLWSLLNRPVSLWYQAKAVQGEYPLLRSAYANGLKRLFPLYLFYILLTAIVVLGFSLVIVPGLIAAYFYVRYFYFTEYYIAEGMPLTKAMKTSREDMKPYFSAAWSIALTQVLVSLVVSLVFSAIFGESGVAGAFTTVALLFIWFLPAIRYSELRAIAKKSASPVEA